VKIHIEKSKSTERQGLLKKVQIWEIHVWYELNEEERELLEMNPDVKKIQAIKYVYKGLDLSPSVGSLTDPKRGKDGGSRIVAYSSGEMMNYENALNEAARQLKDHLMSLKGAEGSSVTEI
jgi:sulfur relay (sulfurtransferase) DsrC/TusE family protein